MSKFKNIAQGFFSAMAPKPNPFIEQTEDLLDDLEPAAQAHILAQLAIAEEINQLRQVLQKLDSTISLKS